MRAWFARGVSRHVGESRPERIEDFDVRLPEIGDIAGHDGQAVSQGGGGNKTVLDRHGRSSRPHFSEEPCPPEACLRCPVEAGDSTDAALKPLLQSLATPAGRQKIDPEPQLTEDDRIDGDLAFMAAKPADDLFIGPWPRGLAEDVRINKELHGGSQFVR